MLHCSYSGLHWNSRGSNEALFGLHWARFAVAKLCHFLQDGKLSHFYCKTLTYNYGTLIMEH